MNWLFYTIYPVIIISIWTVIVKMFPSILGKSVEKYIQHRLDKRLEQFKAEMQASYSTVMKSADLLPPFRTEIIPKSIESAELLWNNVILLDQEYGDIVFLDNILTPDEINEEIQSRNSAYIWGILDRYKEKTEFDKRFIKLSKIAHGKERLFISDNLWIIYMTIYRTYGRFALLIQQSIRDNEYRNWRDDDTFISILREILPENIISDARGQQLGGLRKILIHLDQKLLYEARRVISGSDGLAESFTDIQGMLKSATADIQAERARRRVDES